MPFKEVLESFEFYACVRKQIRTPYVADLCCGHGLVGILFAMFERKVDSVLLLDRERPASFDQVFATAKEIAPWIANKVSYQVCSLRKAGPHLNKDTAILGVHACGNRTDECIGHAIEFNSPLALLPCCRRHRPHPSPGCLKIALGPDVAIDVDRTYRLHNAGYHVRWDKIPAAITTMNRVLVGLPGDRAEVDSQP